MYVILVTLHLTAAAILILVVLLQSGKAGDLASAFGGSTSQAAFGARGAATVLTKATTVCAILFMFTSLGLAIYYSSESGTSVMDGLDAPAAGTEAPVESVPAESPATEQPAGESPDQSSQPAETGEENQ